MSVRVNLLPQATKARGQATRQRGILAGAGLALVLLLVGVWWYGAMQVSAAEDELAEEEAETAALQADRDELVLFEDLAERREQADEYVRNSLAHEVSFAAVLQDLAFAAPDDVQYDTLTVQVDPPVDDEPSVSVGTFSISGQTVSSHAPGVERLLIALDQIAGFDQLYLNTSNLDPPDDQTEDLTIDPNGDAIVGFSVDGRLRTEARTERYADGLPEGLR